MNKQMQIYSVGGHYFYNEEENKIYNEMLNSMNIISALERFTLYSTLEPEEQKYKFNSYEDIKKIYEMKWNKDFTVEEKKLYNNKKYIKRYFTNIENKYYESFKTLKSDLKKNNETYINANKLKEDKEKDLDILLKANKEVRQLNTEKLTKHDIISLFDSNLTRVMNLKFNELSKDLLIVEITQYIIMEHLIERGFDWKNENGEFEHYIFLVASAGQIRKQKIVMIKESVYEKIKDILTCGLTLEVINDNGGCNVNKYLAYLSLNGSATDVWEGFNIDQCIVLDDFETEVSGVVDYIGTKEVEKYFDKLDEKGNKCIDKEGKVIKEKRTVKALLPVERKTEGMTIKIPHSDGCGWILPELSKVSFMCRLPWIKGLLTPCNYILWNELFNNGDFKVKDIDGRTWDLKKDNIKIVFFKSQFKMHGYYKNIEDESGNIIKYGWDIYKDNFKGKNGWNINNDEMIRTLCVANKCNEESKSIRNFRQARFNYQMGQTLVGMTDDELKEFIDPVKDLVAKAYVDRNTQLKLLGATKANKKLTNFQKALMIYPALLKDVYIKDELSDKITAIKNEAREAKFAIDGSYTFIIPDIFAWMEFVFKGNKNPQGLLENGQVYCNIFKGEKELLVERSPHLYFEHAPRENYTGYREYDGKQILLSDWLITNGVYISCHDLITKILQNDVDGDHALVVKGSLVQIAKREMEAMGIVPLYYEMEKAPAEIINSDSIIKSLKSAFHFGNIGKYSNKLTKIWNSEEKDIETAAMLTALNNFYIDGAKTNYCPEVFSSIKEDIKEYKIDQRKSLLQQIEKLNNKQKQEKQIILSTIKNKEEKKAKRTELNEKYKQEITELKIKMSVENNISIVNKKEEVFENDMQHKIKVSDNPKLPYFFRYAKKMNVCEVEKMNNSTVNRACRMIDEIPQGKYYFGTEKFNWHYLTNNFKINLESEKAIAIIEKYEILNNQIKSYFAKAKEDDSGEENVKIAIASRVYTIIRTEFEEFANELDSNIVDATDIIVRYIYSDKNKKDCKKAFLFDVLGDIILRNIEKNIEVRTPRRRARKGYIFCSACGKEVKRESNRQKFCNECADNRRKEKDRIRKSKK